MLERGERDSSYRRLLSSDVTSVQEFNAILHMSYCFLHGGGLNDRQCCD